MQTQENTGMSAFTFIQEQIRQLQEEGKERTAHAFSQTFRHFQKFRKGCDLPFGELDEKMIARLNALNAIAEQRGQKLSQLALSWVLHNEAVTTVLIGASRPEQIVENAACINHLDFTDEEIAAIEQILAQ